jgi:hypothetical protein
MKEVESIESSSLVKDNMRKCFGVYVLAGRKP